MKQLLFSLIASISVSYLFAQNYAPADNGSEVKFSIKNFGFNVTGSFKGLKGNISFNPASLPVSSITASVDATTINTSNGSRDNHLKKEEYLDVAKFPLISFESTKITSSTNPANLLIEGKITIKGVAKNISFPFTATPKNDGFLFAGEFKLDRRDFGVGGNSLVMSDNLTVSLSVLAKKN